MRGLIVIPLTVLVVAAVGYGACRAIGVDPHVGELLAAAGVALVAGEAGIVPLLLSRHAEGTTVAQAGLAGTFVQLLFSIAAALALILAKIGLQQAFLLWLAAFYWFTLVVLVVLIIRQMKSSPASKGVARQ